MVAHIDDSGGNELHVGFGEPVGDGSGVQDQIGADVTLLVYDAWKESAADSAIIATVQQNQV